MRSVLCRYFASIHSFGKYSYFSVSIAGSDPRMAQDGIEKLNESLGTGPDWFWSWVEWNQADAELLPAWFRVASPEQLLLFWKTYFDEILGALIPEYEGFFVNEEGGFHMSEDDMLEFNNWVIVQGKPLWEAVAIESKAFENLKDRYDEARLGALFQIFHETRVAATEGTDMTMRTWCGVEWQPRDGFFPGDMADFIYEDRFGTTLWEQMD